VTNAKTRSLRVSVQICQGERCQMKLLLFLFLLIHYDQLISRIHLDTQIVFTSVNSFKQTEDESYFIIVRQVSTRKISRKLNF
jgi:hypothetical protein